MKRKILSTNARYIGSPERLTGACTHIVKRDCEFMPTCPGPIDGNCRFRGEHDMAVFDEYADLFAEPPTIGYERLCEVVKEFDLTEAGYERWFVFNIKTGKMWLVHRDVMLKFNRDKSSPIFPVTRNMCPTYDFSEGCRYDGYRGFHAMGDTRDEENMNDYLEVNIVKEKKNGDDA
jgi:hypothetical protein